MSRVPPAPVHVLVDGAWICGTVRTCEVTADGQSCSAVVSYGNSTCVTTARFDPTRMRKLTSEPGCPAVREDEACRSCRPRL